LFGLKGAPAAPAAAGRDKVGRTAKALMVMSELAARLQNPIGRRPFKSGLSPRLVSSLNLVECRLTFVKRNDAAGKADTVGFVGKDGNGGLLGFRAGNGTVALKVVFGVWFAHYA
jgi:hypothetical protein